MVYDTFYMSSGSVLETQATVDKSTGEKHYICTECAETPNNIL